MDPKHSIIKGVHCIFRIFIKDVIGFTVPVNMLSFTIHVPAISTASQVIVQPWAGTTITSPGTRHVASTSS